MANSVHTADTDKTRQDSLVMSKHPCITDYVVPMANRPRLLINQEVMVLAYFFCVLGLYL